MAAREAIQKILIPRVIGVNISGKVTEKARISEIITV